MRGSPHLSRARATTSTLRRVGSVAEVAPVRLAELVASLSLGIDLGFGQPMEHVLRQCLIALRLSELLGLDEAERADDLLRGDARQRRLPLRRARASEVVRRRHRAEGNQVRLRAVQPARHRRRWWGCIGSGSSPLHRLRTGFEFARPASREVNDMMARHAGLARELGAQLGLPDSMLDALAASYERWDGRGWPGRLAGDAIPVASRVRTAVRVRRGGAPWRWHRRCGRARGATPRQPSSIRRWSTHSRSTRRRCSATSTMPDHGTPSSMPSPRSRSRSRRRFDDALLAISRFVDLKSPYTIGHSEAVAELSRAAADDISVAPMTRRS